MEAEPIVLSHNMLSRALGDRWSEGELTEALELLARGKGRFPRGTRSLSPGLVRAVQRERLLAAMLVAVNEAGYWALTVQDVLDRARASRPTFYEHFENKEACFLAAFDGSAARLCQFVSEAADDGEEGWRPRLRRALLALLQFTTSESDAARAVLVEARAASLAARRRRDELLDRWACWLNDEVEGDLQIQSSPIVATGIVGGIESVLVARLRRHETAGLEALLPSLMSFAVLPYGGREAAAEELSAGSSTGTSRSRWVSTS